MPLLSAFTRFGHFTLSGEPSHGEKIYKQLKNGLAGQFPDPQVGDRSEAWMYATAMLVARARYAKTRAANQMNPHKVVELLPVREDEYGLVPGAKATIPERQDALAAKYLLPKGARRTAVIEALDAAIGDDFLYYRTTKPGELFAYPPNPQDKGNFIRIGPPAKIVRLVTSVPVLGTYTVTYELIDPTSDPIISGDQVIVAANNTGLLERVVVSAATANTFTAFFVNSHDVGDVCTTGFFPYWVSTQGFVLVIVTPEAAFNPEKRRKVDAVMAEIMRTWVRWSIVPDDGTGTATAAFTIGDPILGRIGYAGIGAVAYP